MDSMKHTDCNHSGDDRYMYGNLNDLPLAMAYVPWQQWRNVLCADKALACGTIFQDLIMPFHCAAVNSTNCHLCEKSCNRSCEKRCERGCDRR